MCGHLELVAEGKASVDNNFHIRPRGPRPGRGWRLLWAVGSAGTAIGMRGSRNALQGVGRGSEQANRYKRKATSDAQRRAEHRTETWRKQSWPY